jgi:hypothetical protein
MSDGENCAINKAVGMTSNAAKTATSRSLKNGDLVIRVPFGLAQASAPTAATSNNSVNQGFTDNCPKQPQLSWPDSNWYPATRANSEKQASAAYLVAAGRSPIKSHKPKTSSNSTIAIKNQRDSRMLAPDTGSVAS